jgi:hypothetical protein
MKSLEEQLELRTRQLKQSVATLEDWLKLVGESASALQKVSADPAVRKILMRIGK